MIFRAAVLGIAALAVLTLLSANARADAPAVAGNAAVVACWRVGLHQWGRCRDFRNAEKSIRATLRLMTRLTASTTARLPK